MEFHDEHPFILRDPNKCILCGLCVRACDEVMGVGALGLVKRGFDTVVMPALEQPLTETGCISCGQCVSVCPTGALQENLSWKNLFRWIQKLWILHAHTVLLDAPCIWRLTAICWLRQFRTERAL